MKIDTSTIAPSGAPVVLFRTCREELDVILASVVQALKYTPCTALTEPDIARLKNIKQAMKYALSSGSFPGSRVSGERKPGNSKKRRKKDANNRFILRLRDMWELIKDDPSPEE